MPIKSNKNIKNNKNIKKICSNKNKWASLSIISPNPSIIPLAPTNWIN